MYAGSDNKDLRGHSSINSAAFEKHQFAAFSVITVGVSDLDEVLNLWVGELGFTVVEREEGDSPELNKLWGLKEGDIARQALIANKNNSVGMIHFVQFNNPEKPVREGAENYDLTPKNLDIHVRDLPEKMDELQGKGHSFRDTDHTEFKLSGGRDFRGAQLLSPNTVNVGMLETVGEKQNYNELGIAGLALFVFTVPNIETESAFFESIFLLDKLSSSVISGPEIEEMAGLPKGTTLKVDIFGHKDFTDGQLEIVEYAGVESKNLYPSARPKSLGILHLGYIVPDATGLKERLKKQGVSIREQGHAKTLAGEGQVISFNSPAGLKIEIYEEQ